MNHQANLERSTRAKPSPEDVLERHRDCVPDYCRVVCDPADGGPVACDAVVMAERAQAAEADAAALAAELKLYVLLWHGCDRHRGEWNRCQYCQSATAALAAHDERTKR